jgi:hypothetical protein
MYAGSARVLHASLSACNFQVSASISKLPVFLLTNTTTCSRFAVADSIKLGDIEVYTYLGGSSFVKSVVPCDNASQRLI